MDSRKEDGDQRGLSGEDAGQPKEGADGGEAGKPEQVVQRGPEEDGPGCSRKGRQQSSRSARLGVHGMLYGTASQLTRASLRIHEL